MINTKKSKILLTLLLSVACGGMSGAWAMDEVSMNEIFVPIFQNDDGRCYSPNILNGE
jgi:hypothetical protein